MTPAARLRPHLVATVLFQRDDAPQVAALLAAMAPDQCLSFLLLEEDGGSDSEREETRTAVTGSTRLAHRVSTATAGVEPNTVYFVPRRRAHVMFDGELRFNALGENSPDAGGGAAFFSSMASDLGDRGCVIVFAGARDQGGLLASALSLVARAGGLVLVQDEPHGPLRRIVRSPEQEHPGTTLVPLHDVPGLIMEHAEPLVAESRPSTPTALYRDIEVMLPALCAVLLAATGHDFGQYKSSTLVRRTLRRLHMLHVESAAAYLERIRSDGTEAMRLFNDLLVNVTAFFRDADAFKALADVALPRLFSPAARGETVRIWVAGCSTGEEAYSIAILIREYASANGPLPPVQIFATDIDELALAHARRGRYSTTRLAHVTPERIGRFFTRSGNSYQVTKDLRDLVLFTRHSVTNDPPFSKLDLVSCRNLLIYLGDELHRRVIPLFHYALRPNGLLFLGPAESTSAHHDLFRPIDVKHRIAERLRTNKRATPFMASRPEPRPQTSFNGGGVNAEADILRILQVTLSEQFTPQGIVVTDEGHIVAVSGNVEAFLAVNPGRFTNNITRLVRDGLRVAMRSALREAAAVGSRVTNPGASLHTAEGVQRVTITVQPLGTAPETTGLFLVVFQLNGAPVATNATATPQHAEVANALIERLEMELVTAREELQRTVQDLEAVNEELKSSNEELLSMNEELQSTNEELETSKEDLQTVNSALEETNNDLANLLVSTRIPTLFLDQDSNVRRATPSAETIYNLRAGDVGRPLSHFTHRAVFMPPLPSAEEAQNSQRPIENEVEMQDGSWFQRRVLPYVTPGGACEGIVVTFTDITERRQFESDIVQSEARLRAIIDSMFAFVGVLDIDGTLLEVNRAPFGGGGLTRADVIGRYFWDCAWFTHDDAVRNRLRDAFTLACGGEVMRYDEVARASKDRLVHIDFMLQPVFRDGRLRFLIPSAVDITHRVQAEALLRSERDVTKAITDIATTAIFMMDMNGVCTFANPAATIMTGYSTDELIGYSLHERVHHLRPDGTHYPEAECSLECGLPECDDIRNQQDIFVRKNGTFFPVVCNVTMIRSNGERRGVVVETRDVTHEQLAARSIAEGQERFRQLAEAIPQLAWMAQPTGDIFWYNQRFYDYTGMAPDALLGWGWGKVHDPEVLPVVIDRWNASIAAGTPFDMVFPILGADGQFRPFRTRANPFRNDRGDVVVWFGTHTDVSEEHERAETLRRRQRELQALADNSPDILTRVDRAYRHVFVNTAVERATGLPASAFLGRTNRELGMPEALCATWEEAIDTVFQTGSEQTVEFEFATPHGRQFFVTRFVAELGPNGEVEFALGVARNHTVEREAETALREANRRKDEFLATLAHELRNPLAPVRNGLEILRLTDNGDSRAVAVREIMERQVVTMTRLIDDLLDISRISLGKVELKREAISLSSIIDNAMEVSGPALQAAHHHVSISLPEEPLILHLDGTRVAQVVGNLLHNAAKYTPEGGRVSLTATREADDVVIRVSDNGIGIPADMLTRVFDMFTQIAGSSTRAQGGLGIGLALVRQLVEMHGGTVQADSAGPGLGSTFTVRLPLSSGTPVHPAPPESSTATLPPTAPGDHAERLSVLVVDDNVDAAKSLETVLSMLGHNADSAFTGAEGVRILTHSVPDFVFLDIGLPDTSGYELAAWIRQQPRLERTIIVALTGWGSDEHRRRAVEAGFDFHLTKPADSAIIRRILTRAVR